jgi:Domain of unknown function (DUF5668)
VTEIGTTAPEAGPADLGTPDPKRRSGGNMTAGLLMIVIGLILLGERMDAMPGLDFGKLWPLILITLGLASWLKPREDGRQGGGWWLVFIGCLFLLNNFRVVTLRQSWPLFIVAGGLSLLLSRDRERRAGRREGR